MTWFIWLYVVPALFILMLVLPAKNMVSKNVLNVLYIMALLPVINLLITIEVIYSLCTLKDYTPYTNDEEIEQKLEELGKQINKLFNKDK